MAVNQSQSPESDMLLQEVNNQMLTEEIAMDAAVLVR